MVTSHSVFDLLFVLESIKKQWKTNYVTHFSEGAEYLSPAANKNYKAGSFICQCLCKNDQRMLQIYNITNPCSPLHLNNEWFRGLVQQKMITGKWWLSSWKNRWMKQCITYSFLEIKKFLRHWLSPMVQVGLGMGFYLFIVFTWCENNSVN